jgi:hypothetical protein
MTRDSAAIFYDTKSGSLIPVSSTTLNKQAVAKFEKDMNAINVDLKQPDKYFKALLRKAIRRQASNLITAQKDLQDHQTEDYLKSIDFPAFWKLYQKHRASKYIKEQGKQ